MFTGIIEEIGTVVQKQRYELHIACSRVLENSNIGDSIAVDGVCLTLTQILGHNTAVFHVSETTLRHTRIGEYRLGTQVNLERALTPASRLGGHIVTGHVDGLARLLRIEQQGESKILEFLPPEALLGFLPNKASVALNGVSLTVCARFSRSFCVTLVPHTWTHTTFSLMRVGDFCHIEIDTVARYVASLLQQGSLQKEFFS